MPRILKKIILTLYGAIIAVTLTSVIVPLLTPGEENNTTDSMFPTLLSFADYDSPYAPLEVLYLETELPSTEKIYVIEHSYDLYMFSMLTGGDDREEYLSLHYVLGKNIDYINDSTFVYGHFFRPVGYLPNPDPTDNPTADPLIIIQDDQENPYAFQGTFDGQGFEITNLWYEPIDLTAYEAIFDSSISFYSMFSSVGEEGTVKNFGLINPITQQSFDPGTLKKASLLIGENYGELSHVYVIENRAENLSGLNVNGLYDLAGLVVENYGSISNVFLSTKKVKSSQVFLNLSTHILLMYNHPTLGSIENLYYDSDVYLDTPNVGEIGTPLETADFQNPALFSNQWFFNSDYPIAVGMNYVYPILMGLNRPVSAYEILRPVDLIYFAMLLDLYPAIATSTFQVIHDLDMSSVSRSAYLTPVTSLTGTFESKEIYTHPDLTDGTLYPRDPGENNYYTIMNFEISRGIDMGNYASYGMLGHLGGTVKDINFANARLNIRQVIDFVGETYVAAGVIAGRMTNGTITNVNVHLDTAIPNQTMTKLHIGGLLGVGSGTISYATSSGEFLGGTHTYHSSTPESSIGGFAGFAGVPDNTGIYLYIRNSENHLDLTGIGYNTYEALSAVYTGGFVGSGHMQSFYWVTNFGDIRSHAEGSFLGESFMGGMIGYQFYLNSSNNSTNSRDIINWGDLTLYVNEKMTGRLAMGYGVASTSAIINGTLNTNGKYYYDVTNHGTSHLDIDDGVTFTPAILQAMDIQIAGIFVTFRMANARFFRMVNTADIDVDLSFVNNVAGVMIMNNMYDPNSTETAFKNYYDNISFSQITEINHFNNIINRGDITATTSRTVYATMIKVSGMILGRSFRIEYARNEGDVSAFINHDAPLTHDAGLAPMGIGEPGKSLIITGVMEEAYRYQSVRFLYNGGHISYSDNEDKTIIFHVFASGIMHINNNPRNDDNMARTDMVFQLLNDGYVTINANVTGNTLAGGIAAYSTGSIMSAINSGDIVNQTNLKDAGSGNMDYFADAAGIVAGLINSFNTTTWIPSYSSSTRLVDPINYGSIVARSNSVYGTVSAGGIIARNTRKWDFSDIENSDESYLYYPRIRHAMNVGSIFSWSNRTDSFDVNDPVYSTSGGIVGTGILLVENTINYGDVYSKTLAGGVFGQFDMYSAGRYRQPSTVFLANLINYGQIGKMNSVSAYQFSPELGVTDQLGQITVPAAPNGNSAFGAILGTVYVGDQADWNFLSGNYLLVESRYKYWLNANGDVDMVGSVPYASTSSGKNTLANKLTNQMYTVKDGVLGDESGYPFDNIQTYTVDAEPGGIFDPSFAFMAPAATTPAIANTIGFIPTMRVNHVLMSKIGWDYFDVEDETMGIFALGPRLGIGEEGLYLPDHFNVTVLNPFDDSSGSWLGEIQSKNKTMTYKLKYGMKQLSESLATNIENIQLVDDPDDITYRVSNPVIDIDNARITFYVSQSSPLAENATETSAPNTAYLPAAEQYEAYGAQEIGGVWVGTHSLVGGVYVPTAGGTHVPIPVTVFTSTPPNEFYINIHEASTYLLGYRASFFYDPGDPSTHINEPATLLNTYGPYYETIDDGVMVDVNDNPIDTYASHYGRIRVYAEAYEYDVNNPDADPMTYKDYDVLVVRLKGSSYTDLLSLTADGVDVLPDPLVDFEDVTVATPIHFKPDGDLGKLVFTYSTINVMPDALLPVGTEPHSSFVLLDSNDEVVPSSNGYSITNINAQDPDGYDPVTGGWSAGTVTYTFTVNAQLAAGDYTIVITVGRGSDMQTLKIAFTKIPSTDALIRELRTTGLTIVNPPTVIELPIRYGLYFNSSDSSTTMPVNFTNFNSINMVSNVSGVINTGRPSNLSRLYISPYATLVSVEVELNPVLLDGYRHQYIVSYTIRPEVGDDVVYTLILTENVVDTNPQAVYLGVNLLDPPYDEQVFPRVDTPSYTYEFRLTDLYAYQNQGLSLDSEFSGFEGSTATNGTEYFLALAANGYTMDFTELAPVGLYEVDFSFQNTYTYTVSTHQLYGVELSWSMIYPTILFQKEGNYNSRIENIAFNTESVYVGANTIITTTIMDEIAYLYYLDPANQGEREIIVIPVEGIDYGESTSHVFYMIGQVANTDLVYYLPDMLLPEGSRIYRVVDDVEYEDLATDFSPPDDTSTFTYIHYRIYAENYIEDDPEFGSLVTDYHIAVQDVTNNVYLTFEIHQDTTVLLETVYLSLSLSFEAEMKLIISLFSYFDGVNPIGSNVRLRNTSSGTYTIHLNLPDAYEYNAYLFDVVMPDNTLVIPDSVIPRRYTIEIWITDRVTEIDWGQNSVIPYVPPAE